jgi:CBS domain-containing protein
MARIPYHVSDYMRTDVVSILADATMKDAVQKMIQHKTNALVVVDAERHLVGILTSWGIIEHLVPDYLEDDRHLASFESADKFVERIDEISTHKVSEVMSTKVHTVRPDDTLMNTATQISQFHIRQLPVVDEQKVVVGYINHTDIKRAIGDALGIPSEE